MLLDRPNRVAARDLVRSTARRHGPTVRLLAVKLFRRNAFGSCPAEPRRLARELISGRPTTGLEGTRCPTIPIDSGLRKTTMKACPLCHRTAADQLRFCSRDGAPLGAIGCACPTCGTEYPLSLRFCPRDGSALRAGLARTDDALSLPTRVRVSGPALGHAFNSRRILASAAAALFFFVGGALVGAWSSAGAPGRLVPGAIAAVPITDSKSEEVRREPSTLLADRVGRTGDASDPLTPRSPDGSRKN